jgi:hypothetical protein
VRYGFGTVGLVLTVAVALRYVKDISLTVVWQDPAYLYPDGLAHLALISAATDPA